MQYLQEVRVDNDTYIIDENNAEITTADVGKGFWLLGYDRDGTCFEMCKINRATAKEIINEGNALVNAEVDITDFGDAVYYWNEHSADSGVLLVH